MTESMLLSKKGGGTSYQHLSSSQMDQKRSEIQKIHPFSKDREKIPYYDKPRGVFSGLTKVQIERFLERNKSRYKQMHGI